MENKFVTDNSIVMAWCFSDETSKYANIVLDGMPTNIKVNISCIN